MVQAEPDFQAGAERAYTAVAAAMAGGNIVYEAAGMYASLMGTCPESLIVDNDVLGACLRMTKGINVDEDSLSLEVIRDVCLNEKGHYLGSDQTLSVMQSEYIYPELGNRSSPNVWMEEGKPNLIDNAVKQKTQILQNWFPDHISDDLDNRIRQEFDIFLSKEAIGRSK